MKQYKLKGLRTQIKKDGNSLGVRITIPKYLRETYNIREGELVTIDVILMRRAKL